MDTRVERFNNNMIVMNKEMVHFVEFDIGWTFHLSCICVFPPGHFHIHQPNHPALGNLFKRIQIFLSLVDVSTDSCKTICLNSNNANISYISKSIYPDYFWGGGQKLKLERVSMKNNCFCLSIRAPCVMPQTRCYYWSNSSEIATTERTLRFLLIILWRSDKLCVSLFLLNK